MRAEPGIMADYKLNGSSNLSVYVSEKREGFFIIHPLGSINATTSPILQNEVEQIFKSKLHRKLPRVAQVHCDLQFFAWPVELSSNHLWHQHREALLKN